MELIGRDREVAELVDRLSRARLVTVIGPGGIGKTALARATAARLAPRFGLGAHLVDLTRTESGDAVADTIAGQLDFPSFSDLLASPTDQPALVVIDNCEHVLDAAATAIADLLHACESPTVLATSRSPLDLPEESVVVLGPLRSARPGLEPADGPAVQLFCLRARDAGGDLGPDDLDSVAELCRALDGIPLALELAAARTRVLTPAEILSRLDNLDMLARPRSRGRERHRSLRATIAWSYEQLAADDRHFFDRLSVLAGAFTLDTAHAVGAEPADTPLATLDRIERLLMASLLVAEPLAGVTRYRQLETLRTFAREQLVARGEWDHTWDRFVDHVVGHLAALVADARERWDATVLHRLLILYDSLMAALRWCLAHDDTPDRSLGLVAALWGVVHQGHAEQVAVVAEQVLARWPDPSHPGWADAAATAATCRYLLGRPADAIALAEAARPYADRALFAPCTLPRVQAQSSAAMGDVEGAVVALDEAVAQARRLGLEALAMEMAVMRAELAAHLDPLDPTATRAHHLAAVRAVHDDAERAGAAVNAVWARCVEGSLLLATDVDRAARVSTDALERARVLGYPACVSVSLHCLTDAALQRGEHASAAGLVEEWLDGLVTRGASSELRNVLRFAAVLMHQAGDPAWADVAATSAALPVVSLFSLPGHERPALPPSPGHVLERAEAVRVARAALRALTSPDTAGPGGRPAAAADGVFRRAGEFWDVRFAGRGATLRPSKGMDDLARLLASPGREIASVELAGAAVAQSSTGPLVDSAARRRYEQRLRALQADIDEAEQYHDPVRRERAQQEFDALVDHLSAALGRGGRARPAADTAERARSTVTQRIRSTIKRVEQQHPELGRHLEAAIVTGTFCCYQPEHPMTWTTST